MRSANLFCYRDVDGVLLVPVAAIRAGAQKVIGQTRTRGIRNVGGWNVQGLRIAASLSFSSCFDFFSLSLRP